MHLAQIAIRRPVTTVMLLVSVVVLGGLALPRLPLLYLPTYDSPRLSIVVPYASSAPAEITRLIVEPIEDVMGTVSHLKRITSQAKAAEGRIRLEFTHNADMDLVAVEVRDRLDRVRWRLPSDVNHLFLRRWSSTDIPVISMRVGWQGAPEDLEEIVEQAIQRRLQALDGVADVRVWGLQHKTLQIEIDPVSLQTHGLTTFQLANLLRRNNLAMSGGAIEDGGVRYLLRSLGAFTSPEQVASLPVRARGVRLRDVARVQYAYPEKTRYDRLDTEEAITVRVYRHSTANVVDVARAVHHSLADMQRTPGLAPLSVFVYHDSSQTILKRLHHLRRTGLVGGGLALGILLLFLRHLRVTIVLGLAIPISVMATFLLMYLLRETLESPISLNLVSLSGLMLSVGMLVDNSVVVLENIFRHRQAGQPADQASVIGAQEVSHAVLVATATSIVVFLPTIFVSTGFIGRLISEFGLVLCIALVASLGISLTAVPLLSARLLTPMSPRPVSLQKRMETAYGQAVAWTLRHRGFVVLLAAGIFGLSLHLFTTILLPNRNYLRTPRRHLYMTIQTERTMPFAQVKTAMAYLEDHLLQARDTLEIRHVVTSFSQDGQHSLTVYFQDLEHSRTPIRTLQARLIEALPQLPGVRYRMRRGRGLGGGDLGIAVQLQGPNGDTLARLAEAVKEQLRPIPGIYSVATDVDRGDDELHLEVDRQQAERLALHPQRVAMTVAFAMSQRPVTALTLDDQEVEVTMHVGQAGNLSTQQLASLPVQAGTRQPASNVGNLARSRVQRAPTSIKLEDRTRTTTVVASTQDRQSLSHTARQISRRLDRLSFPPGYTWALGRTYRRFAASEQESSFTLLLAVVLIYLIMASLFESLLMPLAIMLTVPFALSGVVSVFLLTGTHLNQMSDLGMLILCGLVVNNGIMLIDATNQWRARGLSCSAALIRSSQQRLRPILMTVITTVAGLAPMVAPLFSPALFGPAERYVELYGPIGLVVIGGLCTSTLLTLLLLPSAYALLDDGRAVVRQLRAHLSRQ
ncbi:Multidrug resistance protein MdtB [Candidatus Entotheonellaceae bacterium PAL068K]